MRRLIFGIRKAAIWSTINGQRGSFVASNVRRNRRLDPLGDPVKIHQRRQIAGLAVLHDLQARRALVLDDPAACDFDQRVHLEAEQLTGPVDQKYAALIFAIGAALPENLRQTQQRNNLAAMRDRARIAVSARRYGDLCVRQANNLEYLADVAGESPAGIENKIRLFRAACLVLWAGLVSVRGGCPSKLMKVL